MRGFLLGALALAGAFAPATAQAHAIGLSQGHYVRQANGLDAELVLSRAEAVGVIPGLDADGDGILQEHELADANALIRANVVDRIRVEADKQACAGQLSSARLTEQDGLALAAHYACASQVSPVEVSLDLLESLSRGHRHAARVSAGAEDRNELHFVGNAAFNVGAAASAERATSDATRSPASGSFTVALLRLGAEHILAGYDHLVFLLGLVVVARRLRPLVGVVSAFTLGHSLTFGLAAAGFVTPPAYYVELAIALSIAYVGVENLLRPREQNRAWLTFLFGLVHGFGFASALSEVELPPVRLPFALLVFNLGVELGQLVALAVALPLVLLLRNRRSFSERVVPLLSTLVLALGLFWFATRV